MSYKPKPIDTSIVSLSPEIRKLTERLAENAHENWAAQRLADGWTQGRQRNDVRKEHPCLVPYDNLPESEKVVDRRTAMGTIKAIIALGYRIEPPGPAFDDEIPAPLDELEQSHLAKLLKVPSDFDLGTLLDLWGARNKEAWSRTPELYHALAGEFLRLGEPLLAYDVLAEGVKLRPEDVRLKQLMGLALFRSKATQRALRVMQGLYDAGHRDEETVGMLARAHKDLADMAADQGERDHHWRLAYGLYRKAHDETGGYYSGINAATLARVLGEKEEALRIAARVRDRCLSDLEEEERRGGDRYWVMATLAESALILEETDEALARYTEAASLARHRFGDLASTRRNARLLISGIGLDPDLTEQIERCFNIPRVMLFSGHMIDRPDRKNARFPGYLEGAVKEALRTRLSELDGRIGFASAACGSDILFLETVLEMGGEVHVVLPYDHEQFIQESVDIAPGGNWLERFHRVLDRANEVLVASERQLRGGDLLHHYANLLLLGLAKIRAAQLDTSLIPVTVWDGRPGDGYGGTASAVEHWRKSGLEVSVIDLNDLFQEKANGEVEPTVAAPARGPDPEPETGEFETRLKAMLFADAVGFSKLNEHQVALFVQHFLGGVQEMIEALGHRPLTKETWGDGLYFVFASARETGLFALDLADFVAEHEWGGTGLPHDLNLRIALHAGPVYAYTNPLTGRKGYTGIHVTRAARLEPITPPGQVYTSREFAALASAENVKDFNCVYVGQTPLAKKYGTLPVFHLRRIR